jgi:hypothetical protein
MVENEEFDKGLGRCGTKGNLRSRRDGFAAAAGWEKGAVGVAERLYNNVNGCTGRRVVWLEALPISKQQGSEQ